MRVWYFNLQLPSDVLRNRFILAVTLAGPTMAVIRFGEVIARKSLDADPLMITLLTMVMPVSSLAALWVGQILTGRDQRPFILVAGIISSLALMSGIFMTNVYHLLLMFVFFFLPFTVQLTGQSRILQQHIARDKQGGLFGFSNGLRESMAAVVSLGAGYYMDHLTGGFRHVFLFAGVFNLLSTFVYASMPTKADRSAKMERFVFKHFTQPLKDMVALLKRRPDFFRFEMGFMVYGIAFMTTLPVVPLFLVDELGLDYATIGMARGTVFQLLIIPSMALFGRWFDRLSVHMLASRVFTILAVFPLLLIGAKIFPTMSLTFVYAAFISFGIAMGGVIVLWNISSVRFAGDEDAGIYQSVHLTAMGVRGMFAPLLAYVIMNVFGTITALVVAAVLWVISGQIMQFLNRYDGGNTDILSAE
ncbi:MAG TPA: MFS transporter [Bacteroidetes bacterium]|nr:major Facilitator Superfamily protein [bacterium BMS3Bbin04]HDO64991.1 MFS transporter [Bacteroidota bacterium]HEX04116.1 MFS transporter [Bacteroidota bacterium]